MVRIVEPIVRFEQLADLEEFFNSEKIELGQIWEKDYSGSIVDGLSREEIGDINVKEYGFNTRVLAFISDVEDYGVYIDALTKVAEKLAFRPNLRIGIVD